MLPRGTIELIPNLTSELIDCAQCPGARGLDLRTGAQYPLIDGLRLDIKPATLGQAVWWLEECYEVGAHYPLANLSKAISYLSGSPYWILSMEPDAYTF